MGAAEKSKSGFWSKDSYGKTGLRRICITAAVFIAVVLTTCFLFVKNLTQSSQETALAELQNYAETVQTALKQRISDDFTLLNSIGIYLADTDALDLHDTEAVFNCINRTDSFKSVGYAGLNGEAVMFDMNGGSFAESLAGKDCFLKAIGGENTVQDSAVDAASGAREVWYAVPVIRNGEIIGAVVAVHDPSAFSGITGINKWNGFGYANIINKNGEFVVRADSALIPDTALSVYDIGTFSENDRNTLKYAAPAGGGVYKYTMADGNKMTAVIRPVGVNDWYLMCSLSETYVTAPYYKNAAVIIIAQIAALALFLTLTILYMSIIIRGQRRLEERNRENLVVIEQSGKKIVKYDIAARTLYNYGDAAAMFGIPAVMKNFPDSIRSTDVILPESIDDFCRFFNDMRDGITSGCLNTHMRLTNGETRWFHADYTLVKSIKGEPEYGVVSFYDNTELREKELAYEIRRNELNSLIEKSTYYLEANLMTGHIEKTHGVAVNASSYYGHDFNLKSLIECDARSNVFQDDAESFREFFDKNRLISLYTMGVYTDSLEYRAVINGEFIWNRVTIQMGKYPYTDDIKIYIVFCNITDDHRSLEKLIDKATDDALTGLLNRDTTMQSIEDYLLNDGAEGTHALFMIDIDNFKQVNDNLGHIVGDGALVDIAAAIRRCFCDEDIIGRIGGDEFFAFMKNAGDSGAVQGKANKLINELQCVYTSGNISVDLSGSIGITVYRGDRNPRKTLNLLYAEVDAALYKSKALGKNCFSFADEADATTAATVPEDEHGALTLNLRSLLNNLGGGIEIYRGKPGEPLIPLFCNETFLCFLGDMTESEFFDVYGKDAFAGVHPDDRQKLKELFYEACDNGRQLQHTYRIRGRDRYYWVTITVNFVKYDDGSYDVYAVYADAEQLMNERAAQEDKYRAFRNYKPVTADETVASFHLNLTSDICDDYMGNLPYMQELQSSGTASGFFERIAGSIESKTMRKGYSDVFTPGNLILKYNSGESTVTTDIPLFIEKNRIMWMRFSVISAKNPQTQEIESYAYFFDIDRETRIQYMMRRMMDTEYEFLSQIDVKTGQIMIFGGNTDVEQKLIKSNTVDYNSDLPLILRSMIRDEFYEDALAALSLEHIVAELENVDTYVCSFPTRKSGGMSAGFRQWRCGYIGSRKRIIMMTRTDVTDTLGGDIDPLTGICNQQGFCRRVRETLDANPGEKYRIIRFDIDNFKVLNDSLGFAHGDQVLRDLGTCLRNRTARFKGEVIYARLEADHFVCLRRLGEPDAETLMKSLGDWLDAYPLDFQLMAHMGVYIIENPDIEVSVMCDRALLALKSVKHSFSQRIGYYDESFRDKLIDEQELVSEMYSALEKGQFEIYFQPQVNYEDGTHIGAEALVRWCHPTRGLISPDVFIPLFEGNGFVTILDEYIWDKCCSYLRKWMDSPVKHRAISVSVNISRMDIYSKKLVQTLKDIVKRHNVPASMLKLEITESAYMQHPEQMISTVNELRAAGFVIEMDDFGSGWSSLNTLKDVPVDILKLDMKFLSGGRDNERGGNILSSVIRMAHWLKIPVIAEGVETREQAEYLKSLGCLYMQGYYFARPMPLLQYENMLTRIETGPIDIYDDVSLDGITAFWDPSAQTALLFNSFVGGAAILEYRNGSAEIMRANDKFYQEILSTHGKYIDAQKNTLDRFDCENRQIFVNMLEEAIRTGAEAECEVCSLPHDNSGQEFWTHNRVRLLANNVGYCLFYLSTENITRRKKIEEQLRISREALRLSISSLGRIVCNYDIPAHVLTMPEEYAARYGVAPVVKNIHKIKNIKVLPEDRDKLTDFFGQIHNGVPHASVVLRIEDSGSASSYRWEQLDSATVFDNNSKPVRAVITCRDITAKKEREAENVRNSIIIKNTGILVIDYDVHTDVMRLESDILESGKRVIEDYIGNGISSQYCHIHPDDIQEYRDFIKRLIASKPESGYFDVRSDYWGNGYRNCRVSYVSIGDHNENVYRIVGQVSDIQNREDS